ncbi:hypothetical protein QCA50_011142 [Cerrena zonata]|uniref:C2H2-type domain-containing protein n=1 Tax=Cerrena zonata TaxID=2478898 RepID=A0AAW0FY99_9APHY
MKLPLPQFDTTEWEEGEDDQYEGEDEEDDEAEYDAEAEAIAKRLGDQLLADIAKAQMEAALAASLPSTSEDQNQTQLSQSEPHSSSVKVSRKEKLDATLKTIRNVLAIAEKDTQARAVFSASFVSFTPDASNVFAALQSCISTNTISKTLAKALSQVILSLGQNDTLFGSSSNSSASEVLERGKRKHDSAIGGIDQEEVARAKRVHVGTNEYQHPLSVQLSNAIHVVSSAFSSLPPVPSTSTAQDNISHPTAPTRTPDPAFISSIHLQLHQIFLFAVTSVPRAPSERVALLQDLARLIQMLGILTGIPIGPATTPGAETDIGTAIYPCIGIPITPPCPKTFGKLYSLRVHQSRYHPSHVPAQGMNGMILADRPFRCPQCPASFSRNHDLKRHVKLHERKAWKCGGCDKIFSRRDAIKRHKDRAAKGLSGESTYGSTDGGVIAGNSACAYGQIFEVEVDRDEGEEEASRRAKLWNGIAAREGANLSEGEGEEDSELSFEMIDNAQRMVIDGVYEHLRLYVSSLTGTSLPPAPPPAGLFPHPLVPFQHLPPSAPSQPQPPPPMAALQGPAPNHETQPEANAATSSLTQWLSEDQTRLLEEAIAQAAAQAQAQAEAEAALEEQEEGLEDDEDGEEEDDDVADIPGAG